MSTSIAVSRRGGRNHSWRLVPLLAGLLLLLAFSASSLLQVPRCGITLGRADSGGWQTVERVVPGSSGWVAGLRPGQVVRPHLIARDESSIAAYEIADRNENGGLAIVSRLWPRGQDLLYLFLGLEFGLTGLVVIGRSSDRDSAHRFLIVSSVGAVAFLVMPLAKIYPGWAQAISWLLIRLLVMSLVAFFLIVPKRRWRVMYLLAGLSYLPLAVAYLHAQFVDVTRFDVVDLFGQLYIVLGLGVSAIAVSWPIRSSDPQARHQYAPVAACLWVVVAASLGTLLPGVPGRGPFISPTDALTAWALVPLGFLYAMLRGRIVGVRLGSYPVLRSVLATISDPLYVVDRHGWLVEASKSGLHFLGLARVRDAGLPFDELIRARRHDQADDDTSSPSVLTRALGGATIRGHEQVFVASDGPIVHTSASATPIFDDSGQVDLVVLVLRDVTDRKLSEESARRSELELERRVAERVGEYRESAAELDAFSSTVAHDLRAPLRAMQGFAQALLDERGEQLDETGRGYAGLVVTAAERADLLVQDLLTYSRLCRAEIGVGPQDLVSAVESARARVGERIEATDARIHLGVLPRVIAHQSTLVLVLTELLENALKFTALGTRPEVRVWGEVYDQQVRIWVVDNGIGIDPENQSRIFGIFERLDGASDTHGASFHVEQRRVPVALGASRLASVGATGLMDVMDAPPILRRERSEGMGIGLAIVAKGVARMGGRFGLVSAVGEGSRFWIELAAG